MKTTEEIVKDLKDRKDQMIKQYHHSIQQNPDNANYYINILINAIGHIGWKEGYVTGVEIYRPDVRWVWEENDVLSVRWKEDAV